MTFGDLKTLFAYKYEQTSAPSTGAEVRNKFINLAYKDIAGRKRWNWLLKSGSGVADGTTTFDLASDFGTWGLAKGSILIDSEYWEQINESDIDLYASTSKVFIVRGNISDGYDMYFPKATPDSGDSIAYRYYCVPADMSDDSDVCLVPNGEPVASMAVGKYFQSEGDHDDALPFLEEAENGIDDLLKQDSIGGPKARWKNSSDWYGKDVYSIDQMYQ